MEDKGSSPTKLSVALGRDRSFIAGKFAPKNGHEKRDCAEFNEMEVMAICHVLGCTREELAAVPVGIATATPAAPAAESPDLRTIAAKAEMIAFNVVKIKDNTNINHDELMRAVVKLTEAIEKLSKGIHSDLNVIYQAVKPANTNVVTTASGKVIPK